MVRSVSQDDPLFLFLSQVLAATITASVYNTESVLTTVLFKTLLSNTSNGCEVEKRKTDSGRAARRERERG